MGKAGAPAYQTEGTFIIYIYGGFENFSTNKTYLLL